MTQTEEKLNITKEEADRRLFTEEGLFERRIILNENNKLEVQMIERLTARENNHFARCWVAIKNSLDLPCEYTLVYQAIRKALNDLCKQGKFTEESGVMSWYNQKVRK